MTVRYTREGPAAWLTIDRNAPLSVAAAKRTVYLSAPELWAPVYRSADAQEGPRAFRDKRSPVWQGH